MTKNVAKQKDPGAAKKPARNAKKKTPRPGKKGGRIKAIFAAIVVLGILGCILGAHINAGVVVVKYEEVYLRDLPAAFDGTTALFISDIHLMGTHTPESALDMMESLETLGADILLLGGDYASRSISETKNGYDAKSAMETRRIEFFAGLSDFSAPMGKFGVYGNHDIDVSGLREEMQLGGIMLLQNQVAKIAIGEDALYIAGLDDYNVGHPNISAISGAVNSGDCVIMITHTPDALPSIASSEAADGGKWADVVLAGHTHGGQIRIFGWSPRIPSVHGEKYLTGWVKENGHTMLVSNGAGCTAINLRWGAEAQAHLITFRRSN